MTLTIPPTIFDAERLAVLDSYAILDTSPELGFDDIVHLTCRICAVPVALVSLVAGNRQWFKARVGFSACETDLNSSVCVHALASPDELLIIPDLTADARTADNPLVTGAPHIRFYAGAPLVTPEGQVLGSLCAIDSKPRPSGLTRSQADDLRVLARQVMTQLELRRALALRDEARAAEANIYRVREILRATQDAVASASGNLDDVLQAVVVGAMQALPNAEGGVVELLDGDELEYRATGGTLLSHKGLRLPLRGTLAGHCAKLGTGLLIDDEMRDPRLDNETIRIIGQCAAVFAPVSRAGRVLGVIKLQSGKRAAFAERDLQVLALFANAATVGLAEAAARAEVRAKDVYWRSLFDRLSEGFVVGEVIRDASGRVVDWRYSEINPAGGNLVGIDPATIIGSTVREAFPGIEDEWVDEFAHVVETGEPAAFTRQAGTLRRWYEGRAFKLDANRFGVIFLEVTARVEADARRTALLSVGDRMRDLTSVPAMTQAAAEIVGRTLGATRAGFGHIVGDVEFIDIDPDWTAPGQFSIAGRHRFDDFGNLRESMRDGKALVINDITRDLRTRADPARMLEIGVRALINMPVRERGRAVAMFIVHDTQARIWTDEEVAFLRNVADRVENGVARVRAEDLQTVLNNELAHRLKNTLAIVQSIALQTLQGVSERELVQSFDRRLLALSRAHDVLLQKSWAAARMRAVMESVLTMQADLDRFALNGPDMDISPQAALSLSLLLHEMATNALKYGALSTEAGMVQIAWRTEDGTTPTLVLDWTESGGPAVVVPPPTRKGFGSTLIRMGLMGTRKSDLRYEPLGLRAEFRAPLGQVLVQIH